MQAEIDFLHQEQANKIAAHGIGSQAGNTNVSCHRVGGGGLLSANAAL